MVEQALVSTADEFPALHGLGDGVIVVPEHVLAERFGQDQRLVTGIAIAVVDIGADGERQV